MLRSPPKHMPAAPPAPHKSASRHPRSIPLKCRTSYGSNRYAHSAALLHMMVWHSRDSASESSPHRAYRPGPHSELRSATEFAHCSHYNPRPDLTERSFVIFAARDLSSRLSAIRDGLLRFVGTCAGIFLPHTETARQAVVALAPTRPDLCKATCWMVSTRLHVAAPAHGHAAAGVTCPALGRDPLAC